MIMSEFAAIVLILTPAGVPLVQDPQKPAPHYWKLPGGTGKTSETPKQCVIRETREETGVILSISDLKFLHKEDNGDHILYVYLSQLPETPKLLDKGDEREKTRIVPLNKVLSWQTADVPLLLPHHRKLVEQFVRALVKISG